MHKSNNGTCSANLFNGIGISYLHVESCQKQYADRIFNDADSLVRIVKCQVKLRLKNAITVTIVVLAVAQSRVCSILSLNKWLNELAQVLLPECHHISLENIKLILVKSTHRLQLNLYNMLAVLYGFTHNIEITNTTSLYI